VINIDMADPLETTDELHDLELLSTIGFEGHASNTLRVHPDRNHVLYTLGSTIVIQKIGSEKQSFLSGHNNTVSCLAVSPSGKRVASGQVTHMGFKADVVLWDFESRSIIKKFTLHKVKVEQIAFSPNEKYLVTLGSQDDRSVVVWDLETNEAICGSTAALASSGHVTCLTYSHHDDNVFITGGDQNLRVWTLDKANRKIRPADIDTQKLKRRFNTIIVDADDQYFYAGTATGDILKCSLGSEKSTDQGKCLGRFPSKNLFSLGVTSLELLKNGKLLVGAGDGSLVEMTTNSKGEPTRSKDRSAKLEGAVTSIALRGEGHQFFAGTDRCNVYKFNLADFSVENYISSHVDEVRDVCFPAQSSALFVTGSKEDIRVWNTETNKELLRIHVANMWCNAVCLEESGRLILSGWNDNSVRAHKPQSGKLAWEIPNAHSSEVTAVAITSDGRRVVSGGGEGNIKIWNIENPKKQVFEGVLKEHRGKVTCIKIRRDDQQCITASTDGSCIIWNLREFTRQAMLQANTLFYAVNYHPQEIQVITSGSDRKIGYWDLHDGAQIREVDAAAAGNVNGIDIAITPYGTNSILPNYAFVTCGGDKLVKLWLYNQGIVTHVGRGHSTDISRVKISPDQKYIISVGVDGSILRWRFPRNLDSIIDKLESQDLQIHQ
jgi:WD40 repeat protein